MLSGKTVVLGISGGIAAYKSADLVRRLKKLGGDVHVIMTQSACEFITPLTFRTLSGNPVITGMFDEPSAWDVAHVALAKKASCILVVPATANIIGKVASGIADDMLTTTIIAAHCPVIFAPAMNTGMYDNKIVQENISKLSSLGYKFIEPETGLLACNDIGKGRLAENEQIIESVLETVAYKNDLDGINVLVTAGPTREYIDPVRFISNPSSGKMGYAIAQAARNRGASVCLISGQVALTPPKGVDTVNITSAQEMFDEVSCRAKNFDIIIMAAAVGDFKPTVSYSDKVKKDLISNIELDKTTDILAHLGKSFNGALIGFCMETQDLLENASRKLEAKGADFIVANNLTDAGAGFGVDTNAVTIVHKGGACERLTVMPKIELADIILDRSVNVLINKRGV